MIASIFNTLALAYVANAAIVLETVYETHYFTATAGPDQTVSAYTSTGSIEALPSTTVIQTLGYDWTLTLDASGNYNVYTESALSASSAGSASTTAASTPNYLYSTSSSTASPSSSSAAESSSTSAAETSSSSTTPTSTSSSSSSTSSSSSSTASASATLSDFANECLSYHNQVRALHSAPDLEWNTTLADYAENFLNGNCVFAHSGGPYGENIAMGYGTATAAMEAWYDENTSYDYSNPGFSDSTGHFTQMVWVSTGQLGCYQSDCGSSGNFLVCEYADERGNIIGYFAQNVLES